MIARIGSKPLRSKIKEKKDSEEEVDALPQLSWRIINEITTKQLEIANVNEVAKKFAEILLLSEHETSLKESSQLDYFVAGYWFASREAKFSTEQTSAFITILHILLDNIKTKHLSLGENMKELQSMMCSVGCSKVQSCIDCYTTDTSITTLLYVQTNLFQHYRLFQYIFTEGQDMEVVTTNLTVEVPNADNSLVVYPLPLEESISHQLYLCCLVRELPQSIPDTISKAEEGLMDGLDVAGANEEVTEQEEQLEVSAEDIKSMMEDLAATTLQCYQSKMLQMMKEQENALDTKLSKLEKIISM